MPPATAKTSLMANGLRINWWNVSYIKVQETENEYHITIPWKYKVSIREEYTYLKKSAGAIARDYFQRFGLIPINEEIYINLNKVLLIEEEDVIRGPVDYTMVRIVFVDGFEIKQKTKSEFWNWWKSNYA